MRVLNSAITRNVEIEHAPLINTRIRYLKIILMSKKIIIKIKNESHFDEPLRRRKFEEKNLHRRSFCSRQTFF